jgi:transposase
MARPRPGSHPPEVPEVPAEGRRKRHDLRIALDLADEFTTLIRKQSTGTLADWLSRAEISPCPEVRHFAEGIRRDESAVNGAMTARWKAM